MIGYLTSGDDLRRNDAGESAAAIEAACERRGWNLVEVVRDTNKAERSGAPDCAMPLSELPRERRKLFVMASSSA